MPKVSEIHKERRQKEILDAAFRCFAQRGYHATSMADIFAESGLSPGAVYNYFDGKLSILLELIARGQSWRSGSLPETGLSEIDQLVSLLGQEGASSHQSARLDVGLWAAALSEDPLRKVVIDVFEDVVADLRPSGPGPGSKSSSAAPPSPRERVLLAIILGLRVQLALDPDVDLAACRDSITELLARPGQGG